MTSYNNNKSSYYKHYNKKGYIKDKYFIKYLELRNNYSNSNNTNKNKYNKKGFKKPKVIFKKKYFTKAIISALLVNNNKIITESNNKPLLNNKDLGSCSLIKDLNLNKDLEPNNKVINNYSISNNNLILDSGALKHYTPYKDYLIDYKPVYNKSVIIVNSVKLLIKGIGHILILINKDKLLIRNVNYIPNIKTTLISSKELINKDWEILFKKDIALLSYNNKIITQAK
jgi:Pol polyprotein, beta-barrel domain